MWLVKEFGYEYVYLLDDVSIAYLFIFNYNYEIKNRSVSENLILSGNSDKMGKTATEIKNNLNKAVREIKALETDFAKIKFINQKEIERMEEKVSKWEERINKNVKN